MAGRELPAGLLLVALMVWGCSASTQPVARSEAPSDATASASDDPSAALSPAPPAEAPARDDKPVVVDAGAEEEGGPLSLVEAARAEKERRARAGEPIAVITDKTLPHYASKGQITVADPNQPDKQAAPVPTVGEPAVRDEHYWRSRALEIRLRWRQAADEVGELEQRSAELRQQFYREDDPFIRDNRIKPDWDRVLDRLRQARLDVEAARKELGEFLEEGRRAEALPGWLREGEGEEPKDEAAKQERQPAQSIEPPVLAEPAGEPPQGRS